jgi:hypothetical protein
MMLWAVALVVAGVAPAPSGGATRERDRREPPPVVELASPARDTLVGSRALELDATTRDDIVTLRGQIGTRDIGFVRRRGHWRAVVRAADLLPGDNTLVVTATDTRDRVAHVFRELYKPGAETELGLAVEDAAVAGAQAVKVRLAPGPALLHATLNGRDVSPRFSLHVGEQLVSLGADDGLRAGRNRLEVTAVTAAGAYQRVRLKLRVRGAGPVGAGPDAVVRTGVEYRLAASPGRSKLSGTLRWEVERAPTGSRATLQGSRSGRPRFTPDVRGTYVLRVEVRKGDAVAADIVTLTAQDSSIPPIGSHLDTQLDLAGLGFPGAGGIVLDGQVAYWPQDDVRALLPGPGAILLLLDQSTLELVSITTASAADAGELVTAVNDALTVHPKGIVAVLSLPFGSGGSEQTPETGYGTLLQTLGIDDAKTPDTWDRTIQLGLPFSAVVTIGSAQTTPQVWRSSPNSAVATPSVPALAGNWSGYLQLGNGGVGPYTLAPDTHVPFDTSADATPSSNTVTVGACPGPSCQTFPSQPLTTCAPSGTGGFQVVILAAGTLQPLTNQTFTTNGGCAAAADADALDWMANLLASQQTAGGDEDLMVIVQSIGTPRNANDLSNIEAYIGWTEVSNEVTEYGGNRTVFAQVGLSAGTPQGYTLVGYDSLGLPSSTSPFARETSAAAPGITTARISGLLARNRRNDLVPIVSVVGGVQSFFGTMIYQPPTPWPLPSTDGERRALAYLTTKVAPTFHPPVVVSAANDGNCYDPANPSFRAAYCDTSLDGSWELITIALQEQASLIPLDAVGFTPADWSNVLTQLANETADVSEIPALITNLQTPFGGTNVAAAVDLYTPVNAITQALNANQATQSSSYWLNLLGEVFGLAWAFLPPDVNAIAGLVSEGMAIASQLSRTSDGAPALDARVSVAADKLASELQQRYNDTSEDIAYLREILVTDYGKLLASVNAPGFSTQSLNDLKDGLRRATRAWAYPPLLSSVFRMDQLLDKDGGFTGNARDFQCTWYQNESGFPYHPFRDAPDLVQYSFGLPPPSPPNTVFVLAGPGNPDSGPSEAIYPATPPDTLMTAMFAAPTANDDTTDLAVYPVHFFERDLGLMTGRTITCFQ